MTRRVTGGTGTQSLVLCVVFDRSLFVLLYFKAYMIVKLLKVTLNTIILTLRYSYFNLATNVDLIYINLIQ